MIERVAAKSMLQVELGPKTINALLPKTRRRKGVEGLRKGADAVRK
jgi:hypothetical protein